MNLVYNFPLKNQCVTYASLGSTQADMCFFKSLRLLLWQGYQVGTAQTMICCVFHIFFEFVCSKDKIRDVTEKLFSHFLCQTSIKRIRSVQICTLIVSYSAHSLLIELYLLCLLVALQWQQRRFFHWVWNVQWKLLISLEAVSYSSG